tara:strand:- start:2666 stop:2773 length:108 start_codon:yes stop_codon:yes gene_type:complete
LQISPAAEAESPASTLGQKHSSISGGGQQPSMKDF